MKRTLLISVFIFLYSFVYSQVTFSGYLVDEENKKMKDVLVNLYEGNVKVSTKKWSKKFEYDLKLETYYTLELIKEGFIPKRIAISTFEGDKGADPFMFVMELVKERKGVDNSDLDFPTAIIEYKKNKGEFNFNVAYSKSVKKEQKEALKKKDEKDD
jgi:hypothetical protein